MGTSVEQKCGECRWFQRDTRSPQEVEQLLSQISGLSTGALGNWQIVTTTRSGICLAARFIQEKEYLTFSSFSCTVKNDEGEFQFTPKNPQ